MLALVCITSASCGRLVLRCHNLDDCYSRAQTGFVSSNGYGPTYSSGGIFFGNAEMNPYFYTRNAVHLNCTPPPAAWTKSHRILFMLSICFLPSEDCDGASWTGSADEPVSDNGELVSSNACWYELGFLWATQPFLIAMFRSTSAVVVDSMLSFNICSPLSTLSW
jgi:hypothetical protein